MPPRNAKKILIEEKTGKKYVVKDLDEDYVVAQGVIPARELKGAKNLITSNKKESFRMIDPFFPDLWEQMARGPQVILPKDIGVIIAKTGVHKNSVIVDAGGGSGSLCLCLANICKEITTYEINSEHHAILLKNKQFFGAENLTIKKENIYQGIAEKELDLITLDLPEPWQVLPHAEISLKNGAFVAVYLPNILQVKTFVDAAQRTRIRVQEVLEILERKWVVEDKIVRPEFQMLGHSGFLILCRKL